MELRYCSEMGKTCCGSLLPGVYRSKVAIETSVKLNLDVCSVWG